MEKLIPLLKSNQYNKISFLLGAGVSTSAGMPDFRSIDGLYNKIKNHLNMEQPEKMFDITYFKKYPEKFYYYVKYISSAEYDKYRPTQTHKFIKLLENKNMLNLVYTQNVDSLEIKAGVSENKVIQAHGHRRRAQCSGCKAEYPIQHFFDHVYMEEVMYCEKCNNPVKTAVVFFGERLAESFYDNKNKLYESDLVFLIGTSLKVKPFGYLINDFVNKPKVIINREDLTTSKSLNNNEEYINLLGDADQIINDIIKNMCWEKELENLQ
jgi:NAD-dependent histone deacetylase SIR2